ncbi:unnamed protein product [Lampetra planeri]
MNGDSAGLAGWSEKEALRALPAALDEGTLAAFLSILPLERSSLMQAFDQLVSIYEPPLVAHHKVAKCVGAQQLLHRDRALVTWSQGHRIERGPLRKARRLGVVATGWRRRSSIVIAAVAAQQWRRSSGIIVTAAAAASLSRQQLRRRSNGSAAAVSSQQKRQRRSSSGDVAAAAATSQQQQRHHSSGGSTYGSVHVFLSSAPRFRLCNNAAWPYRQQQHSLPAVRVKLSHDYK